MISQLSLHHWLSHKQSDLARKGWVLQLANCIVYSRSCFCVVVFIRYSAQHNTFISSQTASVELEIEGGGGGFAMSNVTAQILLSKPMPLIMYTIRLWGQQPLLRKWLLSGISLPLMPCHQSLPRFIGLLELCDSKWLAPTGLM